MKYLKKISIGLLSLVLCSTTISMNVSAVSSNYLKGDVNGDGMVSLSDLAYLRNYMSGRKTTYNNNMTQRLDVNRDCIISNLDVDELSRIIVNNTQPETLYYSNNTVMFDVPISSDKYYQKFNAQNGVTSIDDVYCLEAADLIPNSSLPARVVVGPDTRFEDFDNSGIVKLDYRKGTDTFIGTGFVVDTHIILTAAHCMYSTSNDEKAKDLTYTLYKKNQNTGIVTSETHSAVYYHVPRRYIDFNNGDTDENLYATYDYALIKVNEDLSAYMLDLGVSRTVLKNAADRSHTDESIRIYVSGFNPEQNNMVTGYGYFSNNKILNGILNYSTDTVVGESGSPVYVYNEDGSMTVIGIHSRSASSQNFNIGKRIDVDLLNFIFNNPYL